MPAKHLPYKVAAMDLTERERIAALAAAVGLSVSNWFRQAAGLPLVEQGGYREQMENVNERTKTTRAHARPAK